MHKIMDFKKYIPEIIIVLIITALGLSCALQTKKLHAAQNQFMQLQLKFQQYRLDQQSQIQQEQNRRIQAIEDIKYESAQRIAHIQADADLANASANGLRQQLARIHTNTNTTSSRDCKTARTTIRMLTELLARVDKRAQQLARIADERRAAGLACEQVYQALTP